jgi:hypothetical protein
MRRSFVFTTVGLAAGFSGLAIILSIVTPAPLIVAEALTVAVAGMSLVVLAIRAPRPVLVEVSRAAAAGIVAGAGATLVYDVVRTALSVFDPSPFDPFEAVRHFGIGILPSSADPGWILAAGFAVHLINGSSFGVIYAMFARGRLGSVRSALASGIAWGIALELIQSILYPGWLRITTVLGEFLVISGVGHLAYGATLGLGVRHLLVRRIQMEGGR